MVQYRYVGTLAASLPLPQRKSDRQLFLQNSGVDHDVQSESSPRQNYMWTFINTFGVYNPLPGDNDCQLQSYRQEFLQKRKLQKKAYKHHINVLTTFRKLLLYHSILLHGVKGKTIFFCKWRKYHIPQLIVTWCPLAWRASAASTTRRSAPPIPRSGCRKTTRAILPIRISSGNRGAV